MVTEASATRHDPELSLVMPCYNEEEIVSSTIFKLLDVFGKAGYRACFFSTDQSLPVP